MSKPTTYGGMRRFRLDRHVVESGVSGTGMVAQGCVFSDGTTVIRWTGDVATTTVHDSIESVEAIHLHGGSTTIRWEDSICWRCGATPAYTPVWCDACGASDTSGEPYMETRPDPNLGSWKLALTIPTTENESDC